MLALSSLAQEKKQPDLPPVVLKAINFLAKEKLLYVEKSDIVMIKKFESWLKESEYDKVLSAKSLEDGVDAVAFVLKDIPGGPTEPPYLPIYLREDTLIWHEIMSMQFDDMTTASVLVAGMIIHEFAHVMGYGQVEALKIEISSLRLFRNKGMFPGNSAFMYIEKLEMDLAREIAKESKPKNATN